MKISHSWKGDRIAPQCAPTMQLQQREGFGGRKQVEENRPRTEAELWPALTSLLWGAQGEQQGHKCFFSLEPVEKSWERE